MSLSTRFGGRLDIESQSNEIYTNDVKYFKNLTVFKNSKTENFEGHQFFQIFENR